VAISGEVPMRVLVLCASLALLCSGTEVHAATVDPFYAGSYSLTDLGSATGVVYPYGGLAFEAGDNNTLLLGGNANDPSAEIYSIGVTRDTQNHVTGFSGTAGIFANANSPTGGIDGGLTYGPGGILFYTSFPDNRLGEIKSGSTSPDKLVDLGTLNDANMYPVSSSVGSIAFAPNGKMKILIFSSNQWYSADTASDGSGTYDVINVSIPITLSGGLEGAAYVPIGSPLFALPGVLVAEASTGKISFYHVDANGDPVLATRQDFITGLNAAEGAVIDPLTGDFLFSTFDGGEVIRVDGFASPVPEPESVTLVLSSISLLAFTKWVRDRGRISPYLGRTPRRRFWVVQNARSSQQH